MEEAGSDPPLLPPVNPSPPPPPLRPLPIPPPPSTTSPALAGSPPVFPPSTPGSAASSSAVPPPSSDSPSVPSLSDVRDATAVLSGQLVGLISSVHHRSAQYIHLTSAYLQLVEKSGDAAVRDADECCDMARQLMEAVRGMDEELKRIDEVEGVVKRTLQEVQLLEKKVTRTFRSTR